MRVSARMMCLVGLGLLVPACASQDRHTFKSTPLLPTTLSLVDTTSDAVFWQMDIPTGHRLTVDFDHDGTAGVFRTKTNPATAMHWRLRQIGTSECVEQGELDLSGLPLIMTVAYRPSPELPVAEPEPEPQEKCEPAGSDGADEPDGQQGAVAAVPVE